MDAPSHHWQTLDVGDEHTSLTGMVTTTTFLPKTVGEHCTCDAIKMETLDQSGLGLSHA